MRLQLPRMRVHYPPPAALRRRSRDFLQPWEPAWPADDLTRPAFRRRLAAYTRDIETGQGYPFFVSRAEDEVLVGGITLSNVRRGVAQAATMGYWIGQPHARMGYTLTGVREVCRFGFR